MSTTLQSREGFLLEDCRADIARIWRCSNRPLVTLSRPVKPLDQRKAGMRGADLLALDGFDVKPTGRPHGNHAFMGALVFS